MVSRLLVFLILFILFVPFLDDLLFTEFVDDERGGVARGLVAWLVLAALRFGATVLPIPMRAISASFAGICCIVFINLYLS